MLMQIGSIKTSLMGPLAGIGDYYSGVYGGVVCAGSCYWFC